MSPSTPHARTHPSAGRRWRPVGVIPTRASRRPRWALAALRDRAPKRERPADAGRSDPAERRVGLDGLDVRRVRALGAVLGVVGDLRALGQRLEAAALDGGVVDEEVLALVVRGDEAEALLVAEPLHGSGCHCDAPPWVLVLRNAGGAGQ